MKGMNVLNVRSRAVATLPRLNVPACWPRIFLWLDACTRSRSDYRIARQPRLCASHRHSDYAAAKGVLASGFLHTVVQEIGRIAPRGRVNVVCPGWTKTEHNRDTVSDPSFRAADYENNSLCARSLRWMMWRT